MSKQNKHTPGPWLQNTVYNEVGQIIPKVFGKNSSTFILVDGENKEANARLIAAAPELLEALKRVSQSLTMTPEKFEAYRMLLFAEVNEAIAKAEGRE